MYFLVMEHRETNHGVEYQVLRGVYDCLGKAEDRIARLKAKGSHYRYSMPCGGMNDDRGD